MNAHRVETVRYFSDRLSIDGLYEAPAANEPGPAFVFCPGSRVSKLTPFYRGYISRLVSAGFRVLLIDYRGWGASEGEPGSLYPLEQVADVRNGITYLQTRPDVDPDRIGVFGVSMGGAHAVYAAALDERIKAAVAVLSPMDGREMVRRAWREYEWLELLRRLEHDRSRRVTTGETGTLDHLTPVTPERATTTTLAAEPLPPLPMASADAILDYRPLDVISRVSPRAVLLFAATDDPVCPLDQLREAYRLAGTPKRLVEIESREHYGAYTAHAELIVDETVRWFRAYLTGASIKVVESR